MICLTNRRAVDLRSLLEYLLKRNEQIITEEDHYFIDPHMLKLLEGLLTHINRQIAEEEDS